MTYEEGKPSEDGLPSPFDPMLVYPIEVVSAAFHVLALWPEVLTRQTLHINMYEQYEP
jgi:hypothetical protein